MNKSHPYSTFYILYSARGGQSLIEVLIAVTIGVLLLVAATGAIAPALKVGTQTSKAQAGITLAKELLDNVRVWAEGDWHNVANLATSSANYYHLNSSSSPFSVVSSSEIITISGATYTRYFYVDDVYRDAGDNIVNSTSGAVSVDPSTKRVTVACSWPQGGTTSTLIEYITRNRSNVFDQTDWSGGPGQNGPVTSTNSLFSTSSQIDYTTTTGSLYVKFH
jgi:Tfp pilus assembly protein PilV